MTDLDPQPCVVGMMRWEFHDWRARADGTLYCTRCRCTNSVRRSFWPQTRLLGGFAADILAITAETVAVVTVLGELAGWWNLL